ncbi:TPA: hypothetical protein N0F65_000892 [Lagenidium giganteum]|uniref:Cationic amino acid transporter C-terminal domain-containing protein n=1 Tax=Lagenidium giganteum TaxID=4803 RepID=A0AAV2Z1X1_9STRA|nr:TPA: hypothetical protein N0F65_000892 [Lagenidium giganteum]
MSTNSPKSAVPSAVEVVLSNAARTAQMPGKKVGAVVRNDWLHVAFWKKPLELMDTSHGPSHGSSPRSAADTGNVQDGDGGGGGHEDDLERTLGLFDLIMIGIGGTVGPGVFATAGLIASVYAGPAAVLSWMIAGIGCILSGLSFMELSCLIPSAGSTYAYAYHALGELPAMFAGFLLTLEYGVSSAGGARSWSDKFTSWLSTEFGIVGPEWMKPKDSIVDLYAGLMMATCVVIVLGGMQAGKILVNVVTMTKISVVLFIICFGLMKFDVNNVTPFIPESSVNDMGQVVFGLPGVFLGASASFFGYIGYDEVCCLAGEAKNPTYNIPRAVIGTIVGAAFLSTMATFALVGMQKYTEIDPGESYGTAFVHNGWSWASTVVSTGEVFTMPITTFIGFLAQPRVQYAMAKDGLLPEIFARVDHHGNLFHGTLICGATITVLAIFVPFKILWDFISLGILVAFNLTNASLLLVRATRIKDTTATTSNRREIHSHVIGGFMLTSFIAAYHWQKSVIGVVELDEDPDKQTRFNRYMHTFGPTVAMIFSVIACGLMFTLKYLEMSSSPSLDLDDDKDLDLAPPQLVRSSDSEEEIHGSKLQNRRHADGNDGDDDDIGEVSDLRLEDGHNRKLTALPATESEADELDTRLSDLDDDDNGKPQTFQAPFVPFSPCIAIFFNWFLFSQMNASAVVLIVLWLLLAVTVYMAYSRHHSLGRQQVSYQPSVTGRRYLLEAEHGGNQSATMIDPAAYDEDVYRETLLQHMRKMEMIVFDAVFVPQALTNEPILIAVTSTGHMICFAMGDLMGPDYWEGVKTGCNPTHPGPTYMFQAHPTQIYSIEFAGDSTNPLVISGGDQDFRTWRWADIQQALQDPASASAPQPVGIYTLDRKAIGFRGAMAAFNETNDIAVVANKQHVFLAGGDNNAHEWDLQAERCVRQYEAHDDYLHAVQYLNHTQELVTASEDGTVGVWDTRSNTTPEILRPQPTQESKANRQTSSGSSTALWASSLAMDSSETWLACGGGRKKSTTEGFISMWHLPSRVPVHFTETPSNVHDLAFHHTSLLTVGNEPSMKKWNRSSGALLATAHSTLPCAQFCVVDQATDMIAVGGAAPLVDVFMMPGVVSFTLSVD